jgi:NAD(P)-dependent dehydrogenase (short-subunit alcohol dehydrogenase family)
MGAALWARLGMSRPKVWFITGAGSGIGANLAKAALADGQKVVATGRNPDAVRTAIGEEKDLLTAELDVTIPDQADAAVRVAVDRFGRIDLLVNNAGRSFKGFFEEMTPEQVQQQLAANLVGPMNVTRAVLPSMRQQRSGHVISVSSGAGLIGFAYSSVYAASKFGLEGWMGALAEEIGPFGIHTTIINPGWFRTDLIRQDPALWPQFRIDDYAERSASQRVWWEAQDGRQTGDPEKLAQALLLIADQEPPPGRFIAGADAVRLAERKIALLQNEIGAYRNLSISLDIDPIDEDP